MEGAPDEGPGPHHPVPSGTEQLEVLWVPGHGPDWLRVPATDGGGQVPRVLPVLLEMEDGDPATVEAHCQEVRVQGVEGEAEWGGGHQQSHLGGTCHHAWSEQLTSSRQGFLRVYSSTAPGRDIF